jgi:hypothetical protein
MTNPASRDRSYPTRFCGSDSSDKIRRQPAISSVHFWFSQSDFV